MNTTLKNKVSPRHPCQLSLDVVFLDIESDCSARLCPPTLTLDTESSLDERLSLCQL